jgi:hypothetical protein
MVCVRPICRAGMGSRILARRGCSPRRERRTNVATDNLARLEERVSTLIQALNNLRIENQQLKERTRKGEETQRQSELDRQNLDSTIGSLKGDSRERERMLHTAADKLQELVTKLESAG